MSRPPYVSFTVLARGRRPGAADIVDAVLGELARGALPAGSRLPPVRVLEQQLGISKNTVQVAYDELMARGAVETREREGVFVAGSGAVAKPSGAPPLPALRPPPSLSSGVPRRDGISLSSVFVDPDVLPQERLAECARSILRTPGLASHYDPQGYPALREAIAARLAARAIDVDPDEVVITTGSQQALDIVGRALEVRRIGVETPVYPYARMLFENLGLAITALRLDPFAGIDLDLWEKRLAQTRPGLVYAISAFQNPTGYSYASHELTGLLSLAERYRFALLEDDWGSDMLSGSEYRPMLRMLGGKNVLYVNSFTKKVLPSLRVGYLVAHRSLVPSLVAMKRISTLGAAWLTEAILAEFLTRGYYDSHLETMQRATDERYRACLAALEELMPDGVRWTTPGGGPSLWLEVPRSVELATLVARCAHHQVWIDPNAAAFVGEPHLHGLRIGYAYLPQEKLRRGLEVLASELRALLA
jgi:GntR family transcriptional regulator/MocR family aminotransferase